MLSYTSPRRVVQLEYRVQETFASAAALLAWAHEHEENNIPQYTEVLQHFIPNSNGRGLLRLVSGPRANSMLYRRIRGKGHQAALVDQGVQSGDSDEPAPKRRATTQDDKPSLSHSFQLLFGRSVQEKPFAVPQLPSTNLQEVSSGGGNEPNRQPRLHRSSCTSAACYHCPRVRRSSKSSDPLSQVLWEFNHLLPSHCAMQMPHPWILQHQQKVPQVRQRSISMHLQMEPQNRRARTLQPQLELY